MEKVNLSVLMGAVCGVAVWFGAYVVGPWLEDQWFGQPMLFGFVGASLVYVWEWGSRELKS